MPIAVPRSITNGRQPRDLVRWESDASKSILRKNSHPSTLLPRRFIILQLRIMYARSFAEINRVDKIRNV